MMLLRFILRELRRRPGRAVLTLFGIAIGVSTVVAVWTTSGLVRAGLDDMFDAIAGRATLEVVAEGDAGVDPDLARRLATLDGVEAAVPVVQAPAALVTGQATLPVVLFGIRPGQDRAVRRYTLVEGTLLETDGLLLERGLARSLGLAPGRTAVLLTARGPLSLPGAGLLAPEGAASLLGGNIVFLELSRAQELTGLGARVSAIHLVPASGAREDELRDRVAAILPPGTLVQRPSSRTELAALALSNSELANANAGLLSVVLGAFIILNTFLMNLGERRRQLATLRAVGATRGQVGRMILYEAVLFGLAGVLLGAPAGLVVSWGMARGMEQLLLVPLPPARVGLDVLLVGLLLGPGVSVLSALIPSVLSRRVSPLELARGQAVDEEARGLRWYPLVPLALALGTAALSGLTVTGKLGGSWSALGTASGLATVVVSVPLLLRPLVRALALLARPALGPTGTIALRQLTRRPLRNSLTVGVLAAAVATAVGMGNTLLCNVDQIRSYVDRTVVGDFHLRAAAPDPMLLVVPPLPESVGEEVAAIEGVSEVRRARFLQARVGGRRAMLIASTLPAKGSVNLDLTRGDPKEARAGLERGEVVLGQRLAQVLGKAVGDPVTLETPRGPYRTRVAGIMTELTGGGMAISIRWEKARELYGFSGVDVYLIDAAPGRAPAVGAALAEWAGARHLFLQSHESFRELIDRMSAGVLASLWALLGVLFVVAAFGVVNTLAMNVLEQTRELGLLRAVAMTRGQVRRTVADQAVAMALISFVPGGAVGLLMAWLMNAAAPALLGIEPRLVLHGAFVASVFVAAGLVTLLAGSVPALRASRLDVVEALKYE